MMSAFPSEPPSRAAPPPCSPPCSAPALGSAPTPAPGGAPTPTLGRAPAPASDRAPGLAWTVEGSFLCVVKTQIRWSKKFYKTELTKTRYNNQVLGKYRVDPQRAGLTLIAELTCSNLGLKEV